MVERVEMVEKVEKVEGVERVEMVETARVPAGRHFRYLPQRWHARSILDSLPPAWRCLPKSCPACAAPILLCELLPNK